MKVFFCGGEFYFISSGRNESFEEFLYLSAGNIARPHLVTFLLDFTASIYKNCLHVFSHAYLTHICTVCMKLDAQCLSGHGDKSSHFLFIDTNTMHVFCTRCNDYVYDGEFERMERRVRADHIVAVTKSM